MDIRIIKRMVIFVRMNRLEYQHVTDLFDEDTIARNTRISPNFALHNGARVENKVTSFSKNQAR